MDPITAGLFVAASFATSAFANKNQSKIEGAALKTEIAQSKLQNAESAYERTKQFRKSISANLALSGAGYGGVSGFRGVAAEESEDYFADMASLKNSDLFSSAAATSGQAANRAKRFSRDLNAVGDSTQLASQLGLFTKKKGK